MASTYIVSSLQVTLMDTINGLKEARGIINMNETVCSIREVFLYSYEIQNNINYCNLLNKEKPLENKLYFKHSHLKNAINI